MRLGNRAKLCLLASSNVAALFLPTVSMGQTYTGTPDYTINDTQIVYDGIGNVTPLPGGTSVLERVLYQIGQLNTTSPGSIAPVNGIYANIAESVMNREWYTTDRTEVAYENYQQDVVTPYTDPLTFSAALAGPDSGELTSIVDTGTNTPIALENVEIAKVYVYYFIAMIPEDGTSYVQYLGDFPALSYSAGLVDITAANLPADGSYINLNPNNAGLTGRLSSDGSLQMIDTAGDALIFVIEMPDGTRILADTIPDSITQTLVDSGYSLVFDPTVVDTTPFGGGRVTTSSDVPLALDLSTDIIGDFSTGTTPTMNIMDIVGDYVMVYEGGSAKLVSPEYAAANNLTGTISYEVTEYNVDFTRQFDSFYTDWNQRDISTVIDGSVTNIINGVTEASAQAVTAAGAATAFAIPTVDIGDIATTVLGAVNTGDIAVGVNSAVDEASASTARSISASLTVVGGSADTGTMMLNIAHNSSIIQGDVENTLIAVNGSVGSVSTTALGAVNTGTITSGVNAAVQGIVGMSGQTSF